MLSAFAATFALSAICISRHWPFVGDVALIRYAVFLLEHGLAPYRDIIDINFPGSYFLDWSATHIFGDGARAWRLFDLSLLITSGVAMAAIAGRKQLSSSLIAASMFALIHTQDGIAQAGQRDLAVAACLLCSCACLRRSSRRVFLRPFLSGVLVAFATVIKPTIAPALILPFLFSTGMNPAPEERFREKFWTFSGELLPLLALAFWLLHEHALASFWHLSLAMGRLHASVDSRPLGYLLLHSYAPLLPVLLCWLPMAGYGTWRAGKLELYLYGLAGLISYLAQHKGYQYHRYPLLAFLLLIVCMDAEAAIRSSGVTIQKVLACATLLTLVGFLAPRSVWLVRSYDWRNQEFITDLQHDLNQFGAGLNGRVQCLDTTAGCINTLERMQLVQATGFLYDCYLLRPGNDPYMLRLQQQFLSEMNRRPPEVIVVTNQLCLGEPPNFDKLASWPALQTFVSSRYILAEQRTPTTPVRWWSRTQPSAAYRVYALKR